MKININISNPDEWKLAFPPAGGDKQWKDRFSAKELAKIVTNYKNYVGKDFELLLQDNEEFKGLKLINVFPEHLSHFDDNPRGPRHHDLACIAEKDGERIALCFEAKVSESFDKRLSSWQNSDGKKTRCNILCKNFFGCNYNDKFKDVYYQLLSAVAGTIAFASENGCSKAYFIVYQIIPEEKKTSDHKKKINDFIKLVPTAEKKEVVGSGSFVNLGGLKIDRKNEKGEPLCAEVYIGYIEQKVTGEKID